METAQKERLAALLAEVQVAILVTQGENWPTATMQAFAETPELDLLFIMNDATEKFQNLLKHPYVTVFIDAREKGKVETFEISRALIQGVAIEIERDSAAWQASKEIFLKKSPFRGSLLQVPDAAHDARETIAGVVRGRGPLHVQGGVLSVLWEGMLCRGFTSDESCRQNRAVRRRVPARWLRHGARFARRRRTRRYGAAVDEAVARRKRFDNRKLGEKTPYEQSFIQCINLWEDAPRFGR